MLGWIIICCCIVLGMDHYLLFHSVGMDHYLLFHSVGMDHYSLFHSVGDGSLFVVP